MSAKDKNKASKKEDSSLAVKKSAPAKSMSPFEEMDQMFENFLQRRGLQPFHWQMPHWPELTEIKMPKIDIIDREKEIMIKAELTGVKKDDIDVSITDNSVTIKGSTSHEEKEEKGNYYRSEISRGSFSRTVALPSEVDSDKARANFSNGILELTLPKVAKSHRKNITVE